MTEGQSRYGIMEELNNRKINEKEKLANIERETDTKIYNAEKALAKLNQDIKEREGSYVQEHKDKVREMCLRLDLMKSDMKRQIESLELSIKEENNTYEKNFKDWKKQKTEELNNSNEILRRYNEEQTKKIAEKKEIIEEIEKGIDSLKEMSKEHKTE